MLTEYSQPHSCSLGARSADGAVPTPAQGPRPLLVFRNPCEEDRIVSESIHEAGRLKPPSPDFLAVSNVAG